MAQDTVLVEFKAEVGELKAKLKEVEKSLESVDKKADDAQDGIIELGKTSNKVGDGFKQLGLKIAGAFAVATIIDKAATALTNFAVEGVKAAAAAQGIKTAFNGLNQPDLLDNLRQATRGTVEDLRLMQAAVKAQNFKVPLEQLGTFFEFATIRANQTGESVDFLVESIINGIGRKSALVLDNLGISASELQEEIQKVGDFGAAAGNIIARELGKAGSVAGTAAEEIARINANLKNSQLAFGEFILSAGDALQRFIRLQLPTGQLAQKRIDELEIIVVKEAAAEREILKLGQESAERRIKLAEKEIAARQKLVDNANRQGLVSEANFQNERIKIIQSNIDKTRALFVVAATPEIGALQQLRDQVILLEQQREAIPVGREKEILELNIKILAKQEEIDKLLGKTNNALKTNKETREKINIEQAKLIDLISDELKLRREIEDLSANDVGRLLLAAQRRIQDVRDSAASEQTKSELILKINQKLNEDLKKLDDKRVQEFIGRQKSIGDLLKEQIDELKRKEAEAEAKKNAIIQQSFQLAQQLSNSIVSLSVSRADQEIAQLNRVRDAELNNINEQELALNQSRDRREISQREFEDRVNQLRLNRIKVEEDISTKLKIEQTKRARAEKAGALFSATINLAQAIVAALTPATLFLIPFISALGALQLGTILATPIPQFEKGGEVGGKRHSKGGTLIEAEQGEFVHTRDSVSKYKDYIKSIHNDKLEDLIFMKHVIPALREQKKRFQEQSFASNVAASLGVSGNDNIEMLLRGGLQIRNADELGKAIAKHLRNNNDPYRA